MGKYDEQLNQIFSCWIDESKKNNDARLTFDGKVAFTYDGLMYKPDVDVEQEWDDPQKRKIMVILKDQPSCDVNDARTWLRDEVSDTTQNLERKSANRNLKPKFIHNIANLIFGLSQAGIHNHIEYESLNFDKVRQNFLTYPFAFIESKKQGGYTKISSSDLSSFLDRYSEYLKNEIFTLDPNMIVCTHVKIYNKIIDFYGGESKMLRISNTEHNSIRFCPQFNKLIFLSYHPSAPMSYKEFYYGVMSHFHAFLDSEFATKFFNNTPHHI